jgi:Fibrinogen beta and gamma chains, C-terminal globular domain
VHGIGVCVYVRTALPFANPVLIQQRQNSDGDVPFFDRGWNEFKTTFGRRDRNFWLGNEMLHEMTKEDRCKLKVEVQQLSTLDWFYAEYSTFRVDSEANNYLLIVSGYSGDAGDSLSVHSGQTFSTHDRDNDASGSHCATVGGGGFWFLDCYSAGLNNRDGKIAWMNIPSGDVLLKATRMTLECE